jgi:hypothetical protein
MRKVWWWRGGDAPVDIVKPYEMGRAAFALLVQYLPPETRHSRITYRINVRVQLRDPTVAAVIDRHRLRGLAIYVDSDAKMLATRQADLTAEFQQGIATNGAEYAWFVHRWGWLLTQKLATWLKQQRSVAISFGTLLDGIEISGEMDELRHLAYELTGAVDRLASQIETGAAFDDGQIRIYAPGDKAKPIKPKAGAKTTTAPADWGT